MASVGVTIEVEPLDLMLLSSGRRFRMWGQFGIAIPSSRGHSQVFGIEALGIGSMGRMLCMGGSLRNSITL